jgi:alpha-beta hydrolase superfamily lysophospholipase
LTRDPIVQAEIGADPLRHTRISPPLYFGMTGGGRIALDRAGEIRVPTLMLIGGSDPIIDPESGRLFFESLGSIEKTLKVYPEMRHEPLSEAGRSAVIADLSDWLRPRLKPSEGSSMNDEQQTNHKPT